MPNPQMVRSQRTVRRATLVSKSSDKIQVMSWEVIEGLQCELGESLVWDAGRLLLLDIPRQRLHTVADGNVATVNLPKRVSAIVPAEGGLLAVTGRSLSEMESDTGALNHVITIPGGDDLPLNDAVTGRDGQLYTGSIDRGGLARAELYAINANLGVTTIFTGLGASNGIDSLSDGRTVVFADTFADVVRVGLDGLRLDVLHPDGVVVDAEDGIWVASWGHGQVLRFNRKGRLDRVLEVPAANVASLAFGGADLDVLFVTTGWSNLDGSGGEVYFGRPGVRGLAPHRFRYLAGQQS